MLNVPRSIAVSPNGTVYIADTGNHAIRVLTPTFPAIGDNGVTNAASYAPRISPGAIASIFGTGFGIWTFVADEPLPTSTTHFVSVQVNGVAAPLYYVSPGQINFQVPWATPATGTVNIAVVVNGGSSNIAAVPVATAAPGLFVLQSGQAAVLNPDYSVNDPSNPVKAGATIFAYLTGSGPVSPAAKDGVPAPTTSLVYVQASNSATIGNQPATVSFAGLAPGFVGLVQMNIVVPTGLAPGTYPLSVTIDGQTSNAAPITVK
jgi:adhesin/invasin